MKFIAKLERISYVQIEADDRDQLDDMIEQGILTEEQIENNADAWDIVSIEHVE